MGIINIKLQNMLSLTSSKTIMKLVRNQRSFSCRAWFGPSSKNNFAKNHKNAESFDTKDYQNILSNNKYTVFSLTYCPFCVDTKRVLAGKDKSAYVVEVDDLANQQEVRDFLQKDTGSRTFPKNYINGEFVGGNSELKALIASGKFDEL